MMETLERKKKKNLLEEFDYEEKIRHLSLKKRIDWFVQNKKQMGQAEKWEAFDDIMEDYELNDRNMLIERINRIIRKIKKEDVK